MAIKTGKMKKIEISATGAIIIALLIVIASAKLLVLGFGSLDNNKITANNLPALPQNFHQNLLSAVVYDGYLSY